MPGGCALLKIVTLGGAVRVRYIAVAAAVKSGGVGEGGVGDRPQPPRPGMRRRRSAAPSVRVARRRFTLPAPSRPGKAVRVGAAVSSPEGQGFSRFGDRLWATTATLVWMISITKA